VVVLVIHLPTRSRALQLCDEIASVIHLILFFSCSCCLSNDWFGLVWFGLVRFGLVFGSRLNSMIQNDVFVAVLLK